MATVTNQTLYAGTADDDSVTGTSGNDSLSGAGGNDTLRGGAGNDTLDGGSGYNTLVVTGSADAYYWSVNANGEVILTDSVTDAADSVDGSDEGTDTLKNIQAIEYRRPDGTVESTFQLDDYGNAADAGNTQIQYGVWVTGRANFYGDLDFFKLDTVSGQKVLLSGASGSSSGFLAESGSDYNIHNQYSHVYSNVDRTLTWTASGTTDVRWRTDELSATTPMASKGYGFILRRELDGTDAAETLTAGNAYEYLVGGLGDDTLIGSVRSDSLSGGDGNDVMTGGAGNDEIDGAGGTANVAVFSGNWADYTATWTGGSLGLTLADKVAGRDGTDLLTNTQILRFADGDVVLDAESNVPTAAGAVAIGQAFSGSMPISPQGQAGSVDVDYYQQKLAADISTSTAMRLTITSSAEALDWSSIDVQFYYNGTQDALTFARLGSSELISRFNYYLTSDGREKSWIISPLRWGQASDFVATAQRADVRVDGYIRGNTAELGDLVHYTIRLDRVLFGTTGADTLVGDGVAGYIDARDGNDSVTGSALDEQIVGGAGDDSLAGGAGNDTLTDGSGRNVLDGGAGDDLIDISAAGSATAATMTIEGGAGTDTLKVADNMAWTGLTVTGIETLDGNSGRTPLTPQQVVAKGFTTAQNITFRLDPNLATGGTLDASGLSGNLNLRGTHQSDTLTGNAGNNTIYLGSDEDVGAGNPVDTVIAGAGDDNIIWSTRNYQQSSKFFSSATHATKTYALAGSFDGGVGNDRLTLKFDNNYWYHAWGGNMWNQADSPAWRVDLSALTLTNIERLEATGYDANRFWAYPSEFILSATQLTALSATSGLRAVSIVGGGAIDLAHLETLGITTWRFGDAATYQITGTANGDTLTVGSGLITARLGDGNDEFVIDSKALVADVLDGGAGTDTLTVRGTDVDLSGATLTGIEAIKVSSQSLSMTDAQWTALGGVVSRATGATTGYILSVTTPGTTTLAADSPYVGLTGSTGDDRLIGNASDNILVGGEGNDVLNGNAGSDRLVTGAGVDTLAGGEGNDTLVITGKTTVRDSLSGDAGTDTLQVADGQDLSAATLSGIEILKGSGTVTLSATQLAGFSEVNGVTVQLTGDSTSFSLSANTQLSNNARILLPQADTTVVASSGVIGSKGDDTLTGSATANLIYGGRGSDFIDGGAGNDTLIGGASTDTLVGGAGDDRFEVAAAEFSSATSGQIELDGVYLDWKSRIVYADQIDGGTGNDTLRVDVSSDWENAFVIQPGGVANIETLEMQFAGGSPWLYLTADSFAAIASVSLNHSSNGTSRYEWANLTVLGKGQDMAFDNLTADSDIRSLTLKGSYKAIDATAVTIGIVPGLTEPWNNKDYLHIAVTAFDSIALSAGADTLRVEGDGAFTATGGAGDDYFDIRSVSNLTASIDAGAGTDTLDLSGSGFIDISRATLTGIETIRFGGSTIVVSDAQLESLSFDGSGKRFTRTGDTIVGSTGNDNYSGNGTGSFQGGKGDDSVAYVDTAVFTGNLADYDIVRSGATLTVEQARGQMTDGKDTLTSVMNLKFADVTVPKDDAPDHYWIGQYEWSPIGYYSIADLTVADYGKRVSAKKDYASDTDVFAATLAPNSPLAIEGSSHNGNGWRMNFTDVATGQSLQFKSLVYGWVNWEYYNGMSADAKWLPGFNTSEGFKAYEGGDVVFQVNIGGDKIEDYAFTLNFLDDYAGSVDTLGEMNAQTGVIKGYVGEIGDADWIRTQLIAGTKYEFKLLGSSSGGGTLLDPKLQLLDSQGRVVESGFDLATDVVGYDDTLIFRPTESGAYYLAVTDVARISTGSWTLTQQSLDMIAGNTSTTERIDWSGANTFTVTSEINQLSDHDWFRIWLDKGLTYNLRALGASNGGTLSDPQLSLRSVTGILLAQDDNSGGGTDAKLVYSAPDAGWYFLDAGASGNASKGTYILKGSTLADDFSNDLFTTGVVLADTPLHGLVSYNGDSDWFKVGLSAGKVYVINLTGDISDGAELDPLIDPLLMIRDATGKLLFKADDFGGTLNSRAYFTPTVDGLYYLEAKSAFKYDIGAYQLTVTLAPPDDFGNVADATAAALTLATAKNGEIGIPGDKDVFKVTLEAGKVYQVRTEGLAGHAGTLIDPYLRVFDSGGRLVDFDNNSGAGNDAQLYLAPTTSGVYYIEASANKDRGMGTYQVSVTQRDLPPDEAPGDIGTQVFLNPGDSFAGNLLLHNDQDWFGIRLTGGADYVFRLQAAHSGHGTLNDPLLEIRAADGTLIKSVDNMLISNEPATAFSPVASVTYYLVVKAADGQADTGSYTLVTREPDDYSNAKSGAAAITLNQTLDGAINWNDGAFGVRAYDSIGLATDFDEDWFQFSAAQNQVLSVSVKIANGSTLSRPMVELVDGQGRSLAVADGLETNDGLAVATFRAPNAGTYYARIIDGAGATGAYTIALAEGDASDEDGNGAVSLDFVNVGAVIQAQATARIGLPGDSDQFSIALQSGHSYRFETLAVRDGIHAPLASAQLGLSFLASGAATAEVVEVAHDVATPSFFDATRFDATSTGLMTVTVQPLEATQTGQYKLRVIDLGTSLADARPDRVADYVVDTHGVLTGNDNTSGKIDTIEDNDLFAINLTAGNIYDFSVKGFVDGLGTLAQGNLRLLDSQGLMVSSGGFDAASGRTELAVSVFEDGRYYLAVSAADLPGNTGTYVLDTRLRDLGAPAIDDMSADTRSGISVAPGRPAAGRIDYADDLDWVKATLTAGKVYLVDVLANGDGAGGTLKDATLRLIDASGAEIAFDDNSGAGADSRLQFTPGSTGDYFLEVGSNGGEIGTYTVRLRELYSGEADPLKSAQWYLTSLGLDALNGQITGAGVTVGVVDDGIDTSHPDLQKQLDFALAYDTQFNTRDGQPKYPVLVGLPFDDHGTAVAGIIAAEAFNETGIAGIAADAELVSTRVRWTWDQITEALGLQWQFDVSNNSWGAIAPFSDNFNSTNLTFAYQALRTGVEDGRDGLGTVFVFSAGNSAAYGENTNYHNFQNAREVITVAAANADGSVAGFSTPGASVLVGAYGVGLLTTDRHQPGWGYALGSNYTEFSGTSAAAPVVSGVVALMLEANPGLGYRDVQEILAYSSLHPDNQDWKVNAAYDWNLGGLRFNDAMGFGLVDAYTAVTLADTWGDVSTSINEVSDAGRAFGLNLAIPDGDETVLSKTFNIDNAMRVEHIELGVDLRHTRLGDLIVEVVSPNGTVSRLMDRPTVNAEQPFGLSGTDSGVPTHLLWDFSSVQFWGEEAVGDWTVNVKDVRAEEVGYLNSLSLRVYGERDDGNDTYVFTEEGFQHAPARVLEDEFGIDTINASPLRHDVLLDLAAGHIASQGVTYSIADWSVIENAYAGIGADRLVGNTSANHLVASAGDDILEGGWGNDILEGGPGRDTAVYAGTRAEYGISYDPNARQIRIRDTQFSNGDEGDDLLTGIERIVFSDQELSFSATVGNRAPVMNARLFAQPVLVGKGMGIDYALPAELLFDPDELAAELIKPEPVVEAGKNAPVTLDETAGSIRFALLYVTPYQPSEAIGVAEVHFTLLDSAQSLTLETANMLFDDLAVTGSKYNFTFDRVAGTATTETLATGGIELRFKSLQGSQAVFEMRVNPVFDLPPAGVDTMDISLRYDPNKVNQDGTLVDLVSSPFGIVDILQGKNTSLDELDITVRDAAGGELPDWLTFDPVTLQFTGTPPTDYQGQIKVLVEAVDAFGESASDILTFQFGDNQAPVLDVAAEKVITEDAGLVALGITAPVDPEGKAVTVKVLDVPTVGAVLDKLGNTVSIGTVLDADELTELHYRTATDQFGDAGYLRYQATDADGVAAESSLHLFVEAVNDAPRFANTGAKLIIQYPQTAPAVLDLLVPTDPETAITWVKVTALPELGRVMLDGNAVQVNQTLTLAQLNQLTFTLSESVNGPIGGITLLATDGQLSTEWTLALEVQGNVASTTGTTGHDALYGSIGADTLYGAGGNDTLVGNAGNDRLLGGLGNDSVFGGSGNDLLDGSAGNDYLDGGTGDDTMNGGPGADTYLVDVATDLVLEILSGGAGGKDLIVAAVSITAPENVESLQAQPGLSIDLTGNALDNILIGNELANRLSGGTGRDTLSGAAGNDTLDGGAGVDRMAGGAGDDEYWVDSRLDIVGEVANEGTDTVHAKSSYTLASHIETLILEAEAGNATAGGNSLANRLVGNAGNNVLAGGLGADTLEGGLGDDVYVLGDGLDTLIDTGGIDTIRSTLDVTLATGFERIELAGIGDTVAIGNAADNALTGNMGDNILEGGAGVDTLTGGAGSDQFMLAYNGAGKAADQVTDFQTGTDLLIIDLASLGLLASSLGLLSSGTVDPTALVKGAGAKAIDPNDYYLYDTARYMLKFDADGSGTGAAVDLVHLVGINGEGLTAMDIYIAA